MPRLAPDLLARARNISPFLPLLLQTCRTLTSARNELRWLREHVRDRELEQRSRISLLNLCRQRARGVPLQYLLGSQPFGELDILCRPGVLIPRPETEAYTGHLASLLLENPELTGPKISSLRILDLCTGTGCIALSLYALLSSKRPELEIIIRGVDISQIALDLAKANLAHNVNSGNLDVTATDRISFVKGDMLSGSSALSSSATSLPGLASDTQSHWDILISNPPYISSSGFATSTARSVRNFEPKLALVPATSSKAASDSNLQSNDLQQNPEDIFYPRILSTACKTQAKLVLMEVADMVQAVRVVELAVGMGIWRAVEIWRDWPYQDQNEGEIEKNYVDINVNNKFEKILVRGVGEGRAVVCKL